MKRTTIIVEMFKFMNEDKVMNLGRFYWWLKENGFQRTSHIFYQFNNRNIWHREIFENAEFQIDIRYLEKRNGIIIFLSTDIKRRG